MEKNTAKPEEVEKEGSSRLKKQSQFPMENPPNWPSHFARAKLKNDSSLPLTHNKPSEEKQPAAETYSLHNPTITLPNHRQSKNSIEKFYSED